MNREAILWMPDGEPGWPLGAVAGLPLVERNLMALRAAGVDRVSLRCHPGVIAEVETHLPPRLDDPRMPAVELLPADCRQPPAGSSARAVALDGRRVYHPALLRDAVRREREVSYRLADGRPAGIGVIGPGAASVPESLEDLETTRAPEGTFAARADSPAQRNKAERLLFKSLSKPVDGWFSQHLNRPISTRISRVLARFPVHPNLVTVLSFVLVGIPAALLSALGGHAALAAGGVMFQLFSILDGVDGELARVKFQQSRTGQWLDSIADNLSNMLYVAGVTIGVYRALGSDLLLWVGIAAIGLHVLEVSVSFWDLVTNTGSATKLDFAWEFKRPGKRESIPSRLLLVLEPLTRQDFYSLFFMVLAVAGLAWVILPLTAITFCVILLVKLPQLLRRSVQPQPGN